MLYNPVSSALVDLAGRAANNRSMTAIQFQPYNMQIFRHTPPLFSERTAHLVIAFEPPPKTGADD
ncbi:MAG: hypothetical protein ACLVHV_13780 [Oscillospiraceae bacterium]